jgi:hypothetical protein
MLDLEEITEVATKLCSKCKLLKPLGRFRVKSKKTGILMCRCKDCEAEYSSRHYQANKERRREHSRNWYAKNKDRYKDYTRKWREKNIQRARELGLSNQRWRKYRITDEQYTAMKEASAGLCAICGQAAKRLCIDHDHQSGRVRDLLCGQCNAGLGNFRENPATLSAAIEYLQRHMEVQRVTA